MGLCVKRTCLPFLNSECERSDSPRHRERTDAPKLVAVTSEYQLQNAYRGIDMWVTVFAFQSCRNGMSRANNKKNGASIITPFWAVDLGNEFSFDPSYKTWVVQSTKAQCPGRARRELQQS